MNCLSRMWYAPERGKLHGNRDQLIRIIGCQRENFDTFIMEAQTLGFCEVSRNPNANITLINRRMFREEKERKNARLRQKRYYNKHKNNAKPNAKITPPSSSSSKENIIKEKKIFGEFKNVKLTNDELQKLRKRFGDDQTRSFINSLSEYIASKGKKYKDHYATILSWSRRNGYKPTPKMVSAEK